MTLSMCNCISTVSLHMHIYSNYGITYARIFDCFRDYALIYPLRQYIFIVVLAMLVYVHRYSHSVITYVYIFPILQYISVDVPTMSVFMHEYFQYVSTYIWIFSLYQDLIIYIGNCWVCMGTLDQLKGSLIMNIIQCTIQFIYIVGTKLLKACDIYLMFGKHRS